jgi:hypothetical protein
VAAVLVLSVSACSAGGTATAAPAPSSSASGSPSPSFSPSPTTFGPQTLSQKLAPYSTTPVIAEPVIGKDVVRVVGKARALDMYAKVVAYLRAESFKMERLRPKAKYTLNDFASAEQLLSPEQKTAWRKLVRAALAGKKTEVGRLRFQTLWKVTGDGFAFGPAGPYVVDEQIGSPVLFLDKKTGLLEMNMTYSASLRMVRDGAVHRRPLTKRVTIDVAPSGKGFVIEDHYGSLEFGNPLPE